MPISKGQVHDKDGMTPRQRAFADAYIEDPFHPVECMRKAGYTERSANTMSQKVLALPSVSRYIAARMPAADEERARKAKERIATGDEVTAFLSDVMRGQVKDAFGLDAGLSDRISAAKELRRIYDVIDKARASGTLTDDLSKSLVEFANGEWIDPDEEDAAPRTSTSGEHKDPAQGSSAEGDVREPWTADPTPTPTENISLSMDNKTQLTGESSTDSGDFQKGAPQKNFENPITGG